ncbi:calmin isoform X3 [Ornithorhynchus anatinus]|uniref:Calmin n=1 Tax=Ornithorhynchus anatinus TaxID=9258 RepID=A0A6I8P4N0_ORNAN|nr:calmin isoform X3 [Ornithorhynchus anatinus]
MIIPERRPASSSPVERENVQKRTFTRWINLHLEKCKPPLEVKDLFLDIQDGKVLMALLEILSGQKLLHEYKSSSHRIFRLNNIAKALKFLEDSNVKLVSIDAAEIADGNSSLVLGLIWNIILFFQIKELTGNLNRNSSSSSLSSGLGGTDSDSSHPTTPSTEKNVAVSVKDQRRAIRALLAWVQKRTRKYGVAVQDFAASWRSGLAFLAVIKAIDPTLVDMKQALEDSARENLERAFSVAQDRLHIPRLLEPEDVMVDTPDEQSVMTYVAQFLEHFPELEGEDVPDPDKEFPIESTFVHIKETPVEQEGKIFVLNENGQRAYTINHETSQPPPPKVFVCDAPGVWEKIPSDEHLSDPADLGFSDSSNFEISHVSDNSNNQTSPFTDQFIPGCSKKSADFNQSLSEPSVLLPKKEIQRPNSLPIMSSDHFESDTCEQVLENKLAPNKWNESSLNEPLEQKSCLSPTVVTDEKNTILPADSFEVDSEQLKEETPECCNEITDTTKHKIQVGSPCRDEKHAVERARYSEGNSEHLASEASPESSDNVDTTANKVLDDPLSASVKKAIVIPDSLEDNVKQLERTGSLEQVEIIDLTGSNITPDDFPSTYGERSTVANSSENDADELVRKGSKSISEATGSTSISPCDNGPPGTAFITSDTPSIEPPNPEKAVSRLSPENAFQEEDMYNYMLPLEEECLFKGLEQGERIQQESAGQTKRECGGVEDAGPEGSGASPRDREDNISISSQSVVSLKDIHVQESQQGDGADLMATSSSKVSVIPHDLFYYPHYNVPISAVLEAFADSSSSPDGSKSGGTLPETSAQCLQEYGSGPGELNSEGIAQASRVETENTISVTQLATVSTEIEPTDPDRATVPTKLCEEADLTSNHVGPKRDSPKEKDPVSGWTVNLPESLQFQAIENMDQLEATLETLLGEAISSKKKEKRKHVEKREMLKIAAATPAYLPDDPEDEITDHKMFSRASHSDSSIYIRRDANKPVDADHFNRKESRKSDTEERRHLIIRKSNNPGEAPEEGSSTIHTDSITPFVQHQDMMYFILFLWLLVYCLLVFPQLDINKP